ncbi:FIST N-terminal domain-containing protein [Fulvivirgaceae bacterium BMA12]|uniref:FIST N-terminal domain-containing protein n=1 Tax=Agaribacillus aureus TaxID=3051825 RepID=A0ABT8L1Q7_9BACT|nr:FIST N-terminal domain-containing protein [Fulvivirgaceae bacterium BMA12]
MKTQQRIWTADAGWNISLEPDLQEAQLVFVFGGRKALEEEQRFLELKAFYPDADIVMSSTSGEIFDTQVHDDSVAVTAVVFEKTKFKISEVNIADSKNGFKAGEQLASQLDKENLVNVFILSDGQLVNGSELIKGVYQQLGNKIVVTGGLAGDGADFQKTLVGYNQPPKSGNIIAIGFYGHDLKIGHGCIGGWDSFGPERIITRSEGNVLFELDGKSALDLYRGYLGDQASELPGSALLFPLSIKAEGSSNSLVRTILSINEEEKSMTFAGDVPEGYRARLMMANFERLIGGATDAARNSNYQISQKNPELAILISCVGRKLVLNQRIEEEVEAVREVLGDKTTLAGFYSYGEISPFLDEVKCELHNQTMTITTFSEA